MNHEFIAVAMSIVTIPAELATIVCRTVVLRSIMIRADFNGAVSERRIDCHAHRVSGMATLADAVLAPGLITEILEPERISHCLVANGIVVAVETGVGNGEICGSIARGIRL